MTDEATNLRSGDTAEQVLAVLADPRLSGAGLEPCRSVLLLLAAWNPAHPLSLEIAGRLGPPGPVDGWPVDRPLAPFDDDRLRGHDGLLRLVAWLPDVVRATALERGPLRPTLATLEGAAARLRQIAAGVSSADREVMQAVERGLRALSGGDGAGALDALVEAERLAADAGYGASSERIAARFDELLTEADSRRVDGVSRRAIERWRAQALAVPGRAVVLLRRSCAVVEQNPPDAAAPPALAASGPSTEEGRRWVELIDLHRLPRRPRRWVVGALFLLPVGLALLARDPLQRPLGPIVEVSHLGQFSVLVVAVGFALLGYIGAATTDLMASRRSPVGLLVVTVWSLFAAAQAQWVRRVIGTAIRSTDGSVGDGFTTSQTLLLVLLLVGAFLARVAALLTPILALIYRARPDKHWLRNAMALAIGIATALPAVAVVSTSGLSGDDPASLTTRIGAATVGGAIVSQCGVVVFLFIYWLGPLAGVEVVEALRGAVDGIGDFVRSRPRLHWPWVILALKVSFFVTGFAGLLPEGLGGGARLWRTAPLTVGLAGGALLCSVGLALALRSRAVEAPRLVPWVLVAILAGAANLLAEPIITLVSMNFPRLLPLQVSYDDPTFLPVVGASNAAWLLLLAVGAILWARGAAGPGLVLVTAAAIEIPTRIRANTALRFDLFGAEEFDLVLTALLVAVMLAMQTRGGLRGQQKTMVTTLLVVSTVVTFVTVPFDPPVRGLYVVAVIVATLMLLMRAHDQNSVARSDPSGAALLVIRQLAAAAIAALIVLFSVYWMGIEDGEPSIFPFWEDGVAAVQRVVVPLFVALVFLGDVLPGRSREEVSR